MRGFVTPFDRRLERYRRDRLVRRRREAEAGADPERVRRAASRRSRNRLGDLRDDARSLGCGLVRVRDQVRTGRVEELQRDGDRRIDDGRSSCSREARGAARCAVEAEARARSATHTLPSAAASASGIPPRRIVFSTLPERGSRRMTVPSRPFATQSAAGVASTAVGPSPTRVVAATAFVSVSMRTSVLSPAFATHAPAAFTATAAGPWPTGIVVVTSVAGSMRVTVPSARFVTQTEPAPAAIADGSFPTPTDPSDRPESGSMRRDEAVGIDDPDRPERRERSAARFRPKKPEVEAASRWSKRRGRTSGRSSRRRRCRRSPRRLLLVAASAVGVPPIGIARTACRDDRSTRVTLWSSRFATHNAPAPDVIATGRAPTGTIAAIEPDGSRATIEFAATAALRPAALVVARMPATLPRRPPTPTAATTPSRLREDTRPCGRSSLRVRDCGGAASRDGASVPPASSRGRRSLEKRAVDRLGLRRRVRAELLGEQPPAPLVHAQRLRAVAGGRVRLHQPPVPALTERLERDRLLGPLRRLRRVARAQARIGEDAQRADADVGELAPLLVHPAPSSPGRNGCRTSDAASAAASFASSRSPAASAAPPPAAALRRGDDVDPGSFGQLEPVAAEGARQSRRAVDAGSARSAAQLAHEHGQRLVPRRGRRLAPQRLRQLVSRHRSALLGHEIGEEQPTLPPREAPLVDHHAVGLDCDTTREEDLQLEPPSRSLAAHLASI